MRSSLDWRVYYEDNARSLLSIPWRLGPELTEDERTAICSSVQAFQAGESSEGRHLFQSAKRYSERSGDVEYLQAIRLFIAEEQRHARDLARFLQLNGIPLVKTTFTDRIFRRLRKLFGSLEISISVLITAEIIAKVYYAALKEATNSIVLQTLCTQILQDEHCHVEFQAEQLGRLRAGRPWIGLKGTTALQRFLFLGTCLVVWIFHHQVFRKSGYNFRKYWHNNWMEFEGALRIGQNVMEQSSAPY